MDFEGEIKELIENWNAPARENSCFFLASQSRILVWLKRSGRNGERSGKATAYLAKRGVKRSSASVALDSWSEEFHLYNGALVCKSQC